MVSLKFWLSVIWIPLFLWAALGGFSSVFAPGDPETGLWGAFCVLGAFLYALARRSGIFQKKYIWEDLHFLLGLAGGILIALHSGGRLFSPAGLLLLPLMMLFLLGANLRFLSSRRVFRNFHSRANLFFSPASGGGGFEETIRRKEALLLQLDKSGREGSFGLRFGDWLRKPFSAARYLLLIGQEKKQARRRCGPPPGYLDFSAGWGRYLHILAGAGALAGLVFHLIQVCPYIPR